MSLPKDNKAAGAPESKTQKQKRQKEKLIRLDDLIPKGNVTGGRRLFFGATDTQQQPTHKTKE
ncbi:MAG: hypothetical protein ABI883_05715 [Chthoniobacterales bacterium]